MKQEWPRNTDIECPKAPNVASAFPALIKKCFLERCQLPSFEMFSAITRHCLAPERISILLGWHLLETLSRRQLLPAPGLLCKPVSSKSFPTETSKKTRQTCSQPKLWDCHVVAGWFGLDTSTETEKLHTCSYCKTLPLQPASWWWCSSHWAAGLCDTNPASPRGGGQAWGKEDGRADDEPLGGHTDQIGIPISSTGDRALTVSAYHFQLLRDSRLRIRQRQNTAQERLRRWTSWFFVARCPSVRMQRREVKWSLTPRHSESRSISVASPVQENASSTERCHEDVRNQYPFDEGSAPDNPAVQSNHMLMLLWLYVTLRYFTFLDLTWLDVTLLYFTLLYFTLLYFTLLYFTLLYFTLLYFTLLYFTLLYFTLLYFTLLYFTLLYFTLLYFTLLYFTLLYFTLLYFTLLYFALLCFTLLYFALLCFTLLYFALHCFTLLYFASLCFTLLHVALRYLLILPLRRTLNVHERSVIDTIHQISVSFRETQRISRRHAELKAVAARFAIYDVSRPYFASESFFK